MSQKPYWEGKKYAFYQHRECEFFPCHATADPSAWFLLPLLLSSIVRSAVYRHLNIRVNNYIPAILLSCSKVTLRSH